MGGPELALNKHHYPRARARAQQVWVAGVQEPSSIKMKPRRQEDELRYAFS